MSTPVRLLHKDCYRCFILSGKCVLLYVRFVLYECGTNCTHIRIRLTIETVARTHLWLLVEYARDRTPSILMIHAVLQLDNFTIGHHHSIFSSQAAETLSTPCLTCRRRRPSPSRSGAAPSIRRHRELVLACFADFCLICFDKNDSRSFLLQWHSRSVGVSRFSQHQHCARLV